MVKPLSGNRTLRIYYIVEKRGIMSYNRPTCMLCRSVLRSWAGKPHHLLPTPAPLNLLEELPLICKTPVK